jgi:uncharacterized membrane protein YfhO
MSFHPGWKAWVDGKSTKPIHVLPSYIAVPLDAGAHRVELRYEPGPEKVILASAGAIILFGFMILSRRRVLI